MTPQTCGPILHSFSGRSLRMAKQRFYASLMLSLFLVAASKKKPSVKIVTESKPFDCSASEQAQKGDTLLVHYTGALENGQVFDTSRREGRTPFEVTLGAGQVIKGWEDGIVGMCEGEVRKLSIPPELGYGENGVQGVIPGGAVLIFSVELLQIQKKPWLSVPKGSGFYYTIGAVLLIGMLGYELYRRANQQTENAKHVKKEGSRQKSKKKKKAA